MSPNNRVDEAKKTAEEEKMKEHEERGNITHTPKAKEENEKKDDDDDEQTNVQYKHNIFRQRYGRTRRMRSLSWPPCLPNQQMLASTYTTVNNSEESDETPPGERDTNTSVAFDELVDEILEDEALERLFQSIIDADVGDENRALNR